MVLCAAMGAHLQVARATVGLAGEAQVGGCQGAQWPAAGHVCVVRLPPPTLQQASIRAGGTPGGSAPLRRPPACSCHGTQATRQLCLGCTRAIHSYTQPHEAIHSYTQP
jgi:hypothetical protein